MSPCSSSQQLAISNMKEQKLMKQLDAYGSTQTMISCITTTQNVCLVILDFAGLSTNAKDITNFVEDDTNVKMIIVDYLPHQNKVKGY
ncbi:hypothetical protein INT47_002099 [Mucor saturninus]|uniref:Uncharacterized protein n=1 Tax=Mucor saturninus TaxID=64648 RepID=A0A8H7R1C5_9FUNG|nr:hypothetical protein INT47_002099 [Mucor saturninus]